MRCFHYLFGFIVMSGVFVSCKPVVLMQDSYDIERIVLPHYYIQTRGSRIMSVPIYEEFVDSIFTQFSNKLYEFDLDIEISDSASNKISDSLWSKKQRRRFYNHNKIDESYIAKSVPNTDELYLIPYIHYSDTRIYAGDTGTSYHVHIGISFYLIENNKIIYSMSSQKGTKSVSYVTPDEIDWETLGSYVEELWGVVMKRGLHPYIERLK